MVEVRYRLGTKRPGDGCAVAGMDGEFVIVEVELDFE